MVRRSRLKTMTGVRKRSRLQRVPQIKNEINKLLFKPSPNQTDWELMTIIIDKNKAHNFDFLTGFTKWKTVGAWQGEPEEKNIQIQIQYKDTKSESVGKRLMVLLNDYNELVVKERRLYVRTEAIEETTLNGG